MMDFNNLKKYSEFKFNSNAQNIGIFIKGMPNEYIASVYIRLLAIFDEIARDELFSPCVIDDEELYAVKRDIENSKFLLDTIIIQRDAVDSDFSETLINYSKRHNIKIIYEVDDDLINIDKNHISYNTFSKKAEIIKFIVKNSHQVTVSTENLKNTLMEYNGNVEVIHNTLVSYWIDNSVFRSNKKNPHVIKIGYMGTITHNNDLKLIEESVGNVIMYFRGKGIKVIFELIGGTAGELHYATPINVPSNSTNYPNFVKWLKKVANWDIAIAPLAKTNINKSKSGIKYLEYSALGIPSIFSAIGPYKKVIDSGINGILVNNNSIEAWTENMIELIENKTLQNEICFNSKNDVQKNYNMGTVVEQWKKILKNNNRNYNQRSYSNMRRFFAIFLNHLKSVKDLGDFSKNILFKDLTDNLNESINYSFGGVGSIEWTNNGLKVAGNQNPVFFSIHSDNNVLDLNLIKGKRVTLEFDYNAEITNWRLDIFDMCDENWKTTIPSVVLSSLNNHIKVEIPFPEETSKYWIRITKINSNNSPIYIKNLKIYMK